jgi:hypothetical protein
MNRSTDSKQNSGSGNEAISKSSYHLSKDDQKAIKEYLNLGGDITELLSRKFSLKRSRKTEEELKLKLKLARQEIFELKGTLMAIEGKTREQNQKYNEYIASGKYGHHLPTLTL